MTCKKIRNLLCHALVPAVLAVLMVPAIAQEKELQKNCVHSIL